MVSLPPAASDRYLPYAAALGVARGAIEVVRLRAMGYRLIWSRYGGEWHRVRVRYPRLWPRYGYYPWELVWSATVKSAFGMALMAFRTLPRSWLADIDPAWAPAAVFDIAEPIAFLIGVVLVLLSVYSLVAALVVLATPRSLTGQVLTLRQWRSGNDGKPTLLHLAVDEGTSDRTLAWILPAKLADRVRHGDIVRLTAYRWTRAVRHLQVIESGQQQHTEDMTDVDFDEIMAKHADDRVAPQAQKAADRMMDAASWISGEVPEGKEWMSRLLTAREVGRILDLQVGSVNVTKRTLTFETTQPGRPALSLLGVRLAGRPFTLLHRHGTKLAGTGDEAYMHGKHRKLGAVRVGRTAVVVQIHKAGTQPADAPLAELLRIVASRLRQIVS
jgi:hypothetical protein